MKHFLIMSLVLLPIFCLPSSGIAQTQPELDELRTELQRVRANQRALAEEIQLLKGAISSLLQARGGEVRGSNVPPGTVIDIRGAPAVGDPGAPVTIVEFSDYGCPFCQRHFQETLPQIQDEFVETGKVRYVLLDFPIQSRHPHAFKAAEAAHCAGEQGKYWAMHHALFSTDQASTLTWLKQQAETLGLEQTTFGECLSSGRYQRTVTENLTKGQAVQVQGTPTFFIGLNERDAGTFEPEEVIRGAKPYPSFRRAFERLLARVGGAR